MENKIVLKPKNNHNIWSAIILFVCGLIFAAVGIIMIVHTQVNKQYYKTTEATIVEIVEHHNIVHDTDGTTVSNDHDVYVSYEVDGVQYDHVLYTQYDITMEEGKQITITYDTRTPGKPFSAGGNKVLMIASFVASLIIFIMAISVISRYKKEHNKIAFLLNNGKKVRATIVSISKLHESDEAFTTTRSRSYHSRRPGHGRVTVTTTEATDAAPGKYSIFTCEAQNQVFTSEPFYTNELLYPGCTVDVYMLNDDGFIYYVDLESVTTGERIAAKELPE